MRHFTLRKVLEWNSTNSCVPGGRLYLACAAGGKDVSELCDVSYARQASQTFMTPCCQHEICRIQAYMRA